jgi:hypothetical protein
MAEVSQPEGTGRGLPTGVTQTAIHISGVFQSLVQFVLSSMTEWFPVKIDYTVARWHLIKNEEFGASA